jgi:aspartyl-tRNA(Asn)/glutamyl-tRNA(Gln) amidotransferase subunit B
MNYEAVIGLEIHVQLNTRTKCFCGCSTEYGAVPNSHTCPVCLGLPGALPVLNEEALRKGVIAGLSLNCEISHFTVFARKNYFYPDLPKAYQISQYALPINRKGFVAILDEQNEERKVGITRAHLEEDAGKLIHDENPRGPSYIDFNRCGVPLLEIVTEPDIRTPEESYRFLTAVKEILQYTGVSECNMEKGELRVDVNISLRNRGEEKFGVKQEIKNMNSFANVKRALEYEIKRQSRILKTGGSLRQETRLFDQMKNVTVAMRSKEEAHDYRYFPDPDLIPLVITDEFIEGVRTVLPELPEKKRERFISQYGLTRYDAEILCLSHKTAQYFEEASGGYKNPKKMANWILSELLKELNQAKIEIDQFPVTPLMLKELFELMDSGEISGKIAKEVFSLMASSEKTAGEIVDEKGLRQLTDENHLLSLVEEVIEEYHQAVSEYRGGKLSVFGFLVGQVMKKTKGKANPHLVNELLKKEIEAR